MAVYFIRNLSNGNIKIGKSINVSKRIKQLARDVGADLELLGVIKGYSKEEAAFHLKFDGIRLYGEWFDNSADLEDFIRNKTISLDELDESIKRKPAKNWPNPVEPGGSSVEFLVSLIDKTRRPLGDIVNDAGICRNTLNNIKKSPHQAKICTLRALASALGYQMIISFTEIEKP